MQSGQLTNRYTASKSEVARCLLLVLLSFGLVWAQIETLVTFTNRAYGYVVQYPRGWRSIGTPSKFMICNFPASKAVRGSVIPESGAVIKVLVPTELVRRGQAIPATLNEWAALGSAHEEVVAMTTREIEKQGRRLALIEVRSECCGGPPFQDSIEWYFRLDGRLFSASVTYLRADRHATEYVDTLTQVVLSLRAEGVPGQAGRGK
jgi:hypothetical protein